MKNDYSIPVVDWEVAFQAALEINYETQILIILPGLGS